MNNLKIFPCVLFTLALSVAVTLSSAHTQAQQSMGRDVFLSAQQAHGAAALREMKTFQERSKFNYAGLDGRTAAVQTVTRVDLSRQIVRVESYDREQLVAIQQVDPRRGLLWTPKSGITQLNGDLTSMIRSMSNRGLFVLRADPMSLQVLEPIGAVDLGGGYRGTLLRIVLNDTETKLLIAKDGTVIAENSGHDWLIYGDIRRVDGVRWPHQVMWRSGASRRADETRAVAGSQSLQVAINREFSTALFDLPRAR